MIAGKKRRGPGPEHDEDPSYDLPTPPFYFYFLHHTRQAKQHL